MTSFETNIFTGWLIIQATASFIAFGVACLDILVEDSFTMAKTYFKVSVCLWVL